MNRRYTSTKPNKFGGSSVINGEIDHFSSLAGEWWNSEGNFKILHKINPLRVTYIRNQICQHYNREITDLKSLKNLSIIDIGCGGGLICEPLARLGAEVIGIDGSKEAIKVASEHAELMSLNINYYNQLPEEFALKQTQFDVAISMEVVEHVSDVSVFLDSCNRLLKPGGLIISGTLNRSLKSLVLAKLLAEYVINWVPKGTHDWRKFLRPSEFAGHLRANNFMLSDLIGISFDPIDNEWSFSKDLKINYFVSAKKLH